MPVQPRFKRQLLGLGHLVVDGVVKNGTTTPTAAERPSDNVRAVAFSR